MISMVGAVTPYFGASSDGPARKTHGSFAVRLPVRYRGGGAHARASDRGAIGVTYVTLSLPRPSASPARRAHYQRPAPPSATRARGTHDRIAVERTFPL